MQGVSGFNGGAASGGFSLKEETADSVTFGLVWDPSFVSWLEDLTLTVDYYKIEIDDAISAIDRQLALDNCYSAGAYDASSPFCVGTLRFTGGPSLGAWSLPTSFRKTLLNLRWKVSMYS